MKILHIVNNDKFTEGYILFMIKCFPEYNHFFITGNKPNDFKYLNVKNFIQISGIKDFIVDSEVRQIVFDVDKIIVSGVFGLEKGLLFYPSKILNKTYMHYWGGDFYSLRNKLSFKNIRSCLSRSMHLYAMKKCKANIFLIQTEYKAFEEITGIKKPFFVGSMYGDPDEPRTEYTAHKTEVGNRILLGNSATSENRHEEVLHILSKFKEDIEVYCPLSYGDEKYREKIIASGNELLGNSFVPVTDFMSFNEYIDLLGTCRVGIFNNNRQQAMGNISIMIYLKKKIYLSPDTTMYDNYTLNNIIVHSIEALKNESLQTIFSENEEVLEKNYKNKVKMDDLNIHIENWRKVFED